MLYGFKLTPAQLDALAEWAHADGAPILLAVFADGWLQAAQGDDRCLIGPHGSLLPR